MLKLAKLIRSTSGTSGAEIPAPHNQPSSEQFGFLLMPDFSMLSFASMLEPLRMANRIGKKVLYNWHLFAPADGPVHASNGIEFAPTRKLSQNTDIQTLIVVAGIQPLKHSNAELQLWLRGFARNGVRLGATSTGPMILARAGLLKGYKSTIHWENLSGFREQYPSIEATEELFELDRDRLTCSGGTAGLDLMLHLIELRHGKGLAHSVAEQCIHPRIRVAHDLQRMALAVRLSIDHPKLESAVAHMESHLEDPISCVRLAELAGLSQKQLERLFGERLKTTPARYYKQLRLDRAASLLEQTSMSLMEVAIACGFSSVSHFSSSFKARFGQSAKAQRLQLRLK